MASSLKVCPCDSKAIIHPTAKHSQEGLMFIGTTWAVTIVQWQPVCSDFVREQKRNSSQITGAWILLVDANFQVWLNSAGNDVTKRCYYIPIPILAASRQQHLVQFNFSSIIPSSFLGTKWRYFFSLRFKLDGSHLGIFIFPHRCKQYIYSYKHKHTHRTHI